MKLKDIIGPTMIGPSSSHTAGAIRIGNLASYIYATTPEKISFVLYNSFATTGKGHGTDKALVGGCLGFLVDDIRIRTSFKEAKNRNIEISFEYKIDKNRFPNSVDINFYSSKKSLMISGDSIGAGDVRIIKIDDFNVDLRGQYYSLILRYLDKPGTIWKVTKFIQDENINIVTLVSTRLEDTDESMMYISLEEKLSESTIANIQAIDNISIARPVPPLKK